MSVCLSVCLCVCGGGGGSHQFLRVDIRGQPVIRNLAMKLQLHANLTNTGDLRCHDDNNVSRHCSDADHTQTRQSVKDLRQSTLVLDPGRPVLDLSAAEHQFSALQSLQTNSRTHYRVILAADTLLITKLSSSWLELLTKCYPIPKMK